MGKLILPAAAIWVSWKSLGPASAVVVGLFVAMAYHYQRTKQAEKRPPKPAMPTLERMASEARSRNETWLTPEQAALAEVDEDEQVEGLPHPAQPTTTDFSEITAQPTRRIPPALSSSNPTERHGMDGKQRIAIAAGLAIAIMLALVPPWHFTFRGMDESCGYSFIALAVKYFDTDRGCSIDVGRLFIEWGAVAGATALYVILWGKRSH
jgi:hypothetical protein